MKQIKGSTAQISLERSAVEALDAARRRFENEHHVDLSRNQMMRKIVLEWMAQNKPNGVER